MDVIRTVRGDIDPATAGVTLVHEHVIVDTAEKFGERDFTVNDPVIAASELDLPGELKINSIVNATPHDMGSVPGLVLETAQLSQKNIIQGAGLFREATYPPDVHGQSVETIAEQMDREIREGLGGSQVRAGVFGEIGFGPNGVSPVERKVAVAVAMAHLTTGAPILTHTPEGQFAIEHTDIFLESGVDPTRIAVGHIDCNNDMAVHLELAKRGCFLAYDRIGIVKTQSDERRVRIVVDMLERGYLQQILLSGDVARQSRLRVNGGRGYSAILEDFVGLLRQAGVSAKEITTMFVSNPSRFLAFTPK